jgi:hypothetical protein
MFKKFKNKKKHENSFSDSEDEEQTPIKVIVQTFRTEPELKEAALFCWSRSRSKTRLRQLRHRHWKKKILNPYVKFIPFKNFWVFYISRSVGAKALVALAT